MRSLLLALVVTGALLVLVQLGLHRVNSSLHSNSAVSAAEAGSKEAVASSNGAVLMALTRPSPLLRSGLETPLVDEGEQVSGDDRDEEDLVVYGTFDSAKPPFPGVDFQAPDFASDTSTPFFEITAVNEVSASDIYGNAGFGVPDKSLGDAEELGGISYERSPYGELLAPPDPSISDIYQNTSDSGASLTEKYPNAQFVRPGSTGSVRPPTDS